MLLNYLLAVLSGLLLVLIHPRFQFSLLAPFAIAPLVYALAREWVPKHRFLLGYVTGMVFWSGVNYWIHFVISYHGGLGQGLGAVGFVLFVLLRAIPLGLFGLLGGVLVQRPAAVPGIAALWVAIERLPWLFNYTWLHLGNAGVDMPLPMRLAPFTGVYGLSFVFAMLGTAMVVLRLGRPRRHLYWLGVLALMLVLPGVPEPEKALQEAVTVQPNIEDRDDWSAEMAVALQRRLEYLSLEQALAAEPARAGEPVPAAGKPKPALILWPEVPAPLYYLEEPQFRDRVNAMARLTRTPALIGSVARTPGGAPLNSALMISPSGELKGRYDKMFLVPFGEYIPFPFQGLLAKIAGEAGDFVPGTRLVLFDVGSERVGAFICYESAFPYLARRFTAAGATVLVNLSNDGYFGGSGAREQHLSLVRMRAAENRRWILRSTNDGITASIDPAGRVVKTLPSFVQSSDRLPFNFRSDLTVYTRFGDVFAFGCAGLAVLLLILSQMPTYRRD